MKMCLLRIMILMWLLLQNLFDVSLGDDLEVNVSGIDELVEDYLMGEPDDYYEEYRDWKADNLEIEYIFEDKNK